MHSLDDHGVETPWSCFHGRQKFQQNREDLCKPDFCDPASSGWASIESDPWLPLPGSIFVKHQAKLTQLDHCSNLHPLAEKIQSSFQSTVWLWLQQRSMTWSSDKDNNKTRKLEVETNMSEILWWIVRIRVWKRLQHISVLTHKVYPALAAKPIQKVREATVACSVEFVFQIPVLCCQGLVLWNPSTATIGQPAARAIYWIYWVLSLLRFCIWLAQIVLNTKDLHKGSLSPLPPQNLLGLKIACVVCQERQQWIPAMTSWTMTHQHHGGWVAVSSK